MSLAEAPWPSGAPTELERAPPELVVCEQAQERVRALGEKRRAGQCDTHPSYKLSKCRTVQERDHVPMPFLHRHVSW